MRFFSWILFIFLPILSVSAHTIHGIVTNKSGLAVLAKVTHKKESLTTSNLGEFILNNVHIGDSIHIYSDGYKSSHLLIDDEVYFENDYNFILLEDVTTLAEVQINATKNSGIYASKNTFYQCSKCTSIRSRAFYRTTCWRW